MDTSLYHMHTKSYPFNIKTCTLMIIDLLPFYHSPQNKQYNKNKWCGRKAFVSLF